VEEEDRRLLERSRQEETKYYHAFPKLSILVTCREVTTNDNLPIK
jgi:hypothetical protein